MSDYGHVRHFYTDADLTRIRELAFSTRVEIAGRRAHGGKNEVMAIRSFIDDDDGYRDWLNENPRGYVINIQRSINPSDARLHRANCRDLIAQFDRDVQLAGPYIKVCGDTQAALENWAVDNVGGPIKHCEHCHDFEPRLCPSCFVELPATGKCCNCDET